MPTKRRFDLAQLDALAANLYLPIRTAEVFDVAIQQIARQVAGAKEPGIPVTTERIGDKLIPGQLRPLPIAARQAGAANKQFTGHTDRHRL